MTVKTLVLIEDDRGDAVLVTEMLADAAPHTEVDWFATVQSALCGLPAEVDCILLDLGLPDAVELSALERIRSQLPDVPIVVLTGNADDGLGQRALAAGAQDFLVKGQVDGSGLERSVRYAVERGRAAVDRRNLLAAQLLAQENARLYRGLLPNPLVATPDLRLAPFYRPGGGRVPLGGDFYDAVETPTGVHLLIGDVCGHGPDEAALGVALRIAWRALVLSGCDVREVVNGVEQVLLAERQDEHRFASIAMVSVDPGLSRAGVVLCGHPAPLVIGDGHVGELPGRTLPVLGFVGRRPVETVVVDLAADWGLLLFTDGLFEGRADPATSERWGVDGLTGHLRALLEAGTSHDDIVATLVAEAERRNGGPLTDDVAAVLVGRRDRWT